MLSKSALAAITAVALLAFGCSLPWSRERVNELNFVFEWKQNQILVDATVAGRAGKFIVGSAQPRTVLDRAFSTRAGRTRVELGERFATTVGPVIGDLGGIADGILGADVWRDSTLVIDYQRQLIIVSSDPADPMNGRVHHFEGPPTIPVAVDGRSGHAILDSALPDTMVLPSQDRDAEFRKAVHLQVGDYDFGRVEAAFRNTTDTRIGNRLLARFLVKIDYRRGVLSLWRDPRTP